MLDINMTDVFGVLESCKIHLITLAIVVLTIIAIMVLFRKTAIPNKFLIYNQSIIAGILICGLIINLILLGPVSTLVSLATAESGTIAPETAEDAMNLCTEITNEGITLLENTEHMLPLEEGKKLNVFGWASTSPCYGGSGSGSLSDAYPFVSLLDGLSNAGLSLNSELSDFYRSYCQERPTIKATVDGSTLDWTLPEPDVSMYSDAMINNAREFSDTAMIIITRIGGEAADLPTNMTNLVAGTYDAGQDVMVSYDDTFNKGNDWDEGDTYLNLSNREEELIELVCNNFDNVIIVYNGANSFELGFVKDYSQIKSVIWCPGAGQAGFNALGNIIIGNTNPSGKTPDTFVYDLTATPVFNNTGSFTYANMDDYAILSGGEVWYYPHFINYIENIYVGYKFYETAALEGLIDYDATVQYPFGYGLSYTEFEQKMGQLSEKDGIISFDVTVTNIGDTPGKDIVEVYYNPPYENGGIEKASANLIAFEKTNLLKPGDSEKLTISFRYEEMASYDANGEGCYVLEHGDYVISINRDSHTIIHSQTYTLDEDIIYNTENKRSNDRQPAINRFEFAEGNVSYLSRADKFANYASVTKAPDNFNMPEEYKETLLYNGTYDPLIYNNPDDIMPTVGANNNIELRDLRGLDYEDPQWENLLDKMTIRDMDQLIALGGYQTVAIDSIGKIMVNDCDGPAAINNNFTQASSVGFPVEVMIAATWNVDLAEKFSENIGKMADEINVSGWYAPAMNTHRSAFSGRNFEYYSEDGYLAGKLAAKSVIGAKKQGVYAFIKHFALNDQDVNCCAELCTWASEQAIREIYLKPFEIAVKEGGCEGVMSSYNHIGTIPAISCDELLNQVLRDEWGFVGMVITDYFYENGYMDSDRCIRNGSDLCLVNYDEENNHLTDTSSATSVLAMRKACHNILYTVVNSRAYAEENLNIGMVFWKKILISVDCIIFLMLAAYEIYVIKGYKKRKTNQ